MKTSERAHYALLGLPHAVYHGEARRLLEAMIREVSATALLRIFRRAGYDLRLCIAAGKKLERQQKFDEEHRRIEAERAEKKGKEMRDD